MIKITGFDKLNRNLDEALKAIAALDGELGKVEFDPTDPGSIENAIQAIERIIDERVGKYRTNPIVSQVVKGMKEQYRQDIIDKAAAARLTAKKA